MFKRKVPKRARGVDAERLSLFDLESDENPIENTFAWMPVGFARTQGVQGGLGPLPADGELGLSHDEWFDPPKSDGRAARWGIGTAITAVVVLVTDRRLLWVPLDASSVDASMAGAVYASELLGQRFIDLASVEYIQPYPLKDTIRPLPGGHSSSIMVRVQCAPEAIIAGPRYPIWAPSDIPDWANLSNEIHVLLSDSIAGPTGGLLALAFDHAGIATDPPTWPDVARQELPYWEPEHQRGI